MAFIFDTIFPNSILMKTSSYLTVLETRASVGNVIFQLFDLFLKDLSILEYSIVLWDMSFEYIALETTWLNIGSSMNLKSELERKHEL